MCSLCWFVAPELLPEILSTGLKEDRMSIVNLVLSTLKSRVSFCSSVLCVYVFSGQVISFIWLVSVQVVLNKAISKTQKVRFFTPAVLTNIASLYKWNGIIDATADDKTVSCFLARVGIKKKKKTSLVFATVVYIAFISKRCRRTLGLLGDRLWGSLSTVSSLTCVARGSTASAFTTPALAQLAGESSREHVWENSPSRWLEPLVCTDLETSSCFSSSWGWNRPRRTSWWRSWWWTRWKPVQMFCPGTSRKRSTRTPLASKVPGRTMWAC